MASLTRLQFGESKSVYQGALYTYGFTGYGVDTPAYEAGTFLPATPFLGGMRQRTKQLYMAGSQGETKSC